MDGNLFQYESWQLRQDQKQLKEEAIEEELEKRKSAALRKLARFVSPTLLSHWADLLVEAYKYDSDNADIIMNLANISTQELRALDNDPFMIEEDLYERSVQYNEEAYLYG